MIITRIRIIQDKLRIHTQIVAADYQERNQEFHQLYLQAFTIKFKI